jgi:hypothetical protein
MNLLWKTADAHNAAHGLARLFSIGVFGVARRAYERKNKLTEALFEDVDPEWKNLYDEIV